jgi:hypothetical protein
MLAIYAAMGLVFAVSLVQAFRSGAISGESSTVTLADDRLRFGLHVAFRLALIALCIWGLVHHGLGWGVDPFQALKAAVDPLLP